MDDQSETNKTPVQPSPANSEANAGSESPPAPFVSVEPKHLLKGILAVGLVLVLMAGSAYITYYWQHKKLATTEQQVTSLTSRVSNLNDQVQKLESKVSSNQSSKNTPTATSGSTTQATIKVTSLGVQFTVPTTLGDLTYATIGTSPVNGKADITVGLSTSALAKSDSGCAASGGTLGTLSKTSGQYPSSANVDNSTGILVKQFTGFYIAYNSPQAACSTSTTVQNTQQTDRSELKFSNVQLIK